MRTKKPKDPSDERHFLIALPEGEEGGRAIDLMVKDGKVYGVLYDEEPCVVASESQLKKLTKAGIRWSYATNGKHDGTNAKAAQPKVPRQSSVRATRHRNRLTSLTSCGILKPQFMHHKGWGLSPLRS